MLWLYSYYALRLICSIGIVTMVCRILVYYTHGLRMTGILAIPLCRLGCLLALAVALEALGTADDFTLSGAIAIPLEVMAMTVVALACCPFFGEKIAVPEHLKADEELIRRIGRRVH